ncbi:MAG TPA: DUF2490 domain-containing protein [Chitinophagaceae bacterium]|nr:DUF2490 domain-containing protein [Chitinophagaceae bacterium]
MCIAAVTALSLLHHPLHVKSQTNKQTASFTQTWAGYINQTRLSKHWGIWFDAQLFTKDHLVKGLYQSEIRPGAIYYINDNTRISAGYGFINNFPFNGHKNISRPENRLWQQLQWFTNAGRIKNMQWVRFEQRYTRRVANDSTLAPGSDFAYRLRYNYLLSAPVGKSSPWSFVLNNEVYVNFGKNIKYNYFDQNRFFAGFSCRTAPSDNLQFGYMNLFQQLPAGNQYRMIHAVRVYYFNNIDLRRKTPAAKK